MLTLQRKYLQGYYQEAGRAGRDGKRSECILLYAARDIPRIVRLLRSGHGRSKAKFDRGFALLNQVAHDPKTQRQRKCSHETVIKGHCLKRAAPNSDGGRGDHPGSSTTWDFLAGAGAIFL